MKATATIVLVVVLLATGSGVGTAAAQECTYNEAIGEQCATPEAGPSPAAATAVPTTAPTVDAEPTTDVFADEAERGGRDREIAFTGDESATLSYVAAGLIGGGVIMLAFARKKQREES